MKQEHVSAFLSQFLEDRLSKDEWPLQGVRPTFTVQLKYVEAARQWAFFVINLKMEKREN